MSVKVDLRLTEINPPEEEPHRTIYTDLVGLPDPVYLGLTVRIFNDDNVGLYMRVDASGTGWTFTTNDLGLWAAGTNQYRNLDNFGNKAKPASALTEDVTLRLRAYTDAGYSNLKWTKERTVTLVFIKSDDGSWTQDVLNNFDDGTVQGWAVTKEAGTGSVAVAAATDYCLSPLYSLKVTETVDGAGSEFRIRLYKSFTTADRTNVFAILNLRVADNAPATTHHKYLNISRDTTLLAWLGRIFDGVTEDYIPTLKWIRLVLPLPRNTSIGLRVIHDVLFNLVTRYGYVWLDDFMIISKD